MSKVDFETESYRNWLKGWIKTKGLTQAKFTEKHPEAVSSYPVLMSILNGNRNPSLATFFKLFAPMRLRDDELFFMLLLKLENELDFYSKEEQEVREYLKRMRSRLVPFLRGDFDQKTPLSPNESVIVECYQLLNGKHKERVEKSLDTELNLQAGRQKYAKEIYSALRKLTAIMKR